MRPRRGGGGAGSRRLLVPAASPWAPRNGPRLPATSRVSAPGCWEGRCAVAKSGQNSPVRGKCRSGQSIRLPPPPPTNSFCICRLQRLTFHIVRFPPVFGLFSYERGPRFWPVFAASGRKRFLFRRLHIYHRPPVSLATHHPMAMMVQWLLRLSVHTVERFSMQPRATARAMSVYSARPCAVAMVRRATLFFG